MERRPETRNSRPMMMTAIHGGTTARIVGDQDDVGGGDHQLVGERVEQHAQRRDLVAAAREVAVEAVGDGREDEDARRRCSSCSPPARPWRAHGSPGKRGRQNPDQQRHGGDAADRDGVGQVHGPQGCGCRALAAGCARWLLAASGGAKATTEHPKSHTRLTLAFCHIPRVEPRDVRHAMHTRCPSRDETVRLEANAPPHKSPDSTQ